MSSLFATIKSFFEKMASIVADFMTNLFGNGKDGKDSIHLEDKEKEDKEKEDKEKEDKEKDEVKIEVKEFMKKRYATEELDSDRIKRSKNATIKKKKNNKKPFKLVVTSNRPFVLGTWAMTDDEPIDFNQPLNL